MIAGSVNAHGEAVVPVRVRGPGNQVIDINTIVDKGFNDWLTLTVSQIQALGLLFREEARFTLADGSEIVSRIFTAEIEWLGAWRRILAVEMDGGPLLGMAILRGFYLGIEAIDGGRVEIRPLNG